MEIVDIHKSIGLYFALEKQGTHPHFSDNNGTTRILFCSSHFGVGKSTCLTDYAGRLALQYLETLEGDFPVFIALNKINRDTRIAEYLEVQEKLVLQPGQHRSYIFLMDGLDESCPPAKEDLEIILDKLSEFFKRFKDGNSNTKMIITSRPLLGPTGYVAQRIGNISGYFLHLSGLTEEQGETFIQTMRNYDTDIEHDLTMKIIIEKLLSKEEDYSKPLFLKMILQLFRHKAFSVAQLQKGEGISKVELYLTFLNNLTIRVKLKDEEEEKDIKIILRYFLRRIAARREMNDHKFLEERGVSISKFKAALTPEEKSLFTIIEDKKILMVCHFGVNKDLLEFIHLSFREFLVAEYLLEIFLLNLAHKSRKYQLHIGYISDEAIKMFNDLAGEFAAYIDNPWDDHRKNIFHQFLASIHKTCDSKHLATFLSEEDSLICLNKDKAGELKSALFTATQTWLHDQSVYFTSLSGEQSLLGERIHTSKVILSKNGVYCEHWYCLLFIKWFIEEEERCEVDLREILPESLHCSHFRYNLLELCLVNKFRVNLTGSNLFGVYLSRAFLSGADLSGANLSRANLFGADLSGADLSGADFSGADFSGAFLSGAALSGADLPGADLPGAFLTGAFLIGADLSEANLSGADLSGANLFGANLFGAYLSGADLSEADLSEANFFEANLFEVNLTGADLRFTNILEARDLTGTILKDTKCDEEILRKAKERGAIVD